MQLREAQEMILLMPLFLIVFVLLLILKLLGGPISWFLVWLPLALFVLSFLVILWVGYNKQRQNEKENKVP